MVTFTAINVETGQARDRQHSHQFSEQSRIAGRGGLWLPEALPHLPQAASGPSLPGRWAGSLAYGLE